MSLLDIVRKVAPRLGLRRPSAVVNSTDLTAQTFLELLNEEGDELARYHEWQNLIVSSTYTTIAQVEQTGALPADYQRLARNVEIWNRTNSQRYVGPTPQRTWQELLSADITAGVAGWWRILGNELQIYPAPTAGQTIAFEYISKNWCQSAAGVGQSEWLSDDDEPLLPAQLFELGLRWRFQQQKGLATYAESMSTYERQKEKAAAYDRGSGRIRPSSNDSMPPQPTWSGTIDN